MCNFKSCAMSTWSVPGRLAGHPFDGRRGAQWNYQCGWALQDNTQRIYRESAASVEEGWVSSPLMALRELSQRVRYHGRRLLEKLRFQLRFISFCHITEVVASLTRRGTSYEQFCVRFLYIYFSRYVAFLRQLSTAGTDRNRQRLTETTGRDVTRLTETGIDRRTDRQKRTRILKGWVVDARKALPRNLLAI